MVRLSYLLRVLLREDGRWRWGAEGGRQGTVLKVAEVGGESLLSSSHHSLRSGSARRWSGMWTCDERVEIRNCLRCLSTAGLPRRVTNVRKRKRSACVGEAGTFRGESWWAATGSARPMHTGLKDPLAARYQVPHSPQQHEICGRPTFLT